MSIDIWFTIDTGGIEPARVGESLNISGNVQPLCLAAGVDLSALYRHTGAEVLNLLRRGVQDMRLHPQKFMILDVPNVEVTYASCIEFLEALIVECEKHPKATITVV